MNRSFFITQKLTFYILCLNFGEKPNYANFAV